MHSIQRVSVCLGFLFTILHTTICAPSQPASSNLLPTGNDLSINLPQPSNTSVPGGLGSSSKNPFRDVGIDHMTWTISDTLHLAVTICNWEPDPVTILAVLAAAESAIGKKSATALLEKRFVQKSSNKYNTLLLEIGPHSWERSITWGDVGEVLGKNGLVKFYEETGQWHTIYFDIVDKERGPLGRGAVRRWWQLAPQT